MRSITEITELQLDPAVPEGITVKSCEDPREGFDMEIQDGRVKVGFTLSEAKRLGWFIASLMERANNLIKQTHKDIMHGKITKGTAYKGGGEIPPYDPILKPEEEKTDGTRDNGDPGSSGDTA